MCVEQMNRKTGNGRFKQKDELRLVHVEWDKLLRQGEVSQGLLDIVVSVWDRSLR